MFLRLFVIAAGIVVSINLYGVDPTYIWGPRRGGLQSGARLLSASGKLQPGDPIVVEFVLRNTSDESKTIVIQQYDDTHPTLGTNNRIELNILGSSQRRWQHELGPGDLLKKRQYRVSVSTEGLPDGQYNVTANSAFWLTVKPNHGTGIPHSRPIPVTIGNPERTQLSSPEPDLIDTIHWGGQVAGLMAGARMPDGKSQWKNGQRVEARMFLYNASENEIRLEYEIPAAAANWNLHLEHESKQYVRLDSTFFTGVEPQIRATVSVKPGETVQITGLERKVSIGGKEPIDQLVSNPSIQLLEAPAEFQYGDPKRLIGGKGNYTFNSAITIHRDDIPDLTMVLSAGGIPFSVNESVED